MDRDRGKYTGVSGYTGGFRVKYLQNLPVFLRGNKKTVAFGLRLCIIVFGFINCNKKFSISKGGPAPANGSLQGFFSAFCILPPVQYENRFKTQTDADSKRSDTGGAGFPV